MAAEVILKIYLMTAFMKTKRNISTLNIPRRGPSTIAGHVSGIGIWPIHRLTGNGSPPYKLTRKARNISCCIRLIAWRSRWRKSRKRRTRTLNILVGPISNDSGGNGHIRMGSLN